MSIIGSNALAGASGAGGAAGYQIERSLRFNSGDSAYLSKTFSSAGNRKTWTWSGWIKRSGSAGTFLGAGNATNDRMDFQFNASGQISLFSRNGTSTIRASLNTDAAFKDFSAWYHVIIAFDASNVTAADRIKIYVNGVEQSITASTAVANVDHHINNTLGDYIGTRMDQALFLDAYIADVHFVDGQTLDETSFGEFDDNGIWQPKAFEGTYGTNGFHLDFSDTSSTTSGSNAGIGKDVSGNENYWDSNNIDPLLTNNGINIDVTSTPFTDIGNGITVTNPNAGTAVSTTTAATNSFNLTTVADVGAAGTFKVGPTTIPTDYTIDYYFRTSSSQPNNAKAIYSRDSTDSFGVVDDWTNGTTSTQRRVRLRTSTSQYTDYPYTVTDDAWNHVRITKTNIWVNGTSITSSPRDIGDIALREFEIGGTSGYEIDGEFGPFRMVPKDLGAPPAGGLVANSDGTLPNESVPNTDTDSFVDSPTNYEADSGNNGGNYAIFNALDKKNTTLAEGNLEATVSPGSVTNHAVATIAVTSGKYYWEIQPTSSQATGMIGVADLSVMIGERGWANNSVTGAWGYYQGTGQIWHEGTNTAYGTTYAQNDIIGVALDMDASTVTFYKNNTSQGSFTLTGVNGPVTAWVGSGSATFGNTFMGNFGQRPFVYTPPTEHVSLCSTNLPDPLISKGSDHFDVALWTGNGQSTPATQSITSFDFQPDFLWYKTRNPGYHHGLQDSVRGVGLSLSTSRNDISEQTETDGLVAFTSNGFNLDGEGFYYINADNVPHVGWAWNGGDLATNSTYNQSEVWSDGWVLDNNSSWISGPELSFDGFTGANTTQTRINGGATWTAGTAVPFTTSLRIWGFDAGSGSIEINGTDVSSQVTDGTSGAEQWNTITGITSPLSTIRITGTTSVTTGIGAVEVDGKILVDTGVIPIGGLNSSLYNQDQIWSTYGTFTGSYFNGIYTWDNVFSADMGYGSTGALYVAAGGTLAKWVLTSSLTCNSEFKFYCYNNTTITLNEGLSDEVTSTSTGGQSFHYHTIPFSGQIQSVKMASTVTYLIRLFVDGKALIDSDVTMPNVPSMSTTVRANPTAGFSIVTYTGNGSGSQNVAHNLNAVPALIIHKNRDATANWLVRTNVADGSIDFGYLNPPDGTDEFLDAGGDYATAWTSEVFSIGSDALTNTLNENYVAYCFTPVSGYSSLGVYTGNGDPDGPFVYTGFRPRWILIKRYDTEGNNWVLHDTARDAYNPATKQLLPSTSGQETDTSVTSRDIVSNGFKLLGNNAAVNASDSTYLYMAFAEHPFKTARAR